MFTAMLFKSFPTAMHSLRVAMISYEFSRILGKGVFSSIFAFLSGLYHDAGKLLVPNKILHKQGKLTEEERTIIETHTTNVIARFVGLFFPAAKQHHLDADGSGYGIGEQDDVAQIIEIADVFDAVQGYYRTYRSPISSQETIQILDGMMKKFNPSFYADFHENIVEFDCPEWYKEVERGWRKSRI